MGGASHFYLWPMQDRFTFAEMGYITNQQLLFCLFTNKPGTEPTGLNYDKDSWGIYGNPAQEIRVYHVTSPYYRKPWCTYEYSIQHGQTRDTVTFKITVQYDSSKPWRSWGEPIIDFLPFKAESIEIISTNAHDAVVTDNIVILNIWNVGDPLFMAGETREVVFSVNSIPNVAEEITRKPAQTLLVYPNPFRSKVTFAVRSKSKSDLEIRIYDVSGRLVRKLDPPHPSGRHWILRWDGRDRSGRVAPTGIYFYRIGSLTGKLIKAR